MLSKSESAKSESIKYPQVYFWYTMNEVTTVKIGRRTKTALDGLKSENETYDKVISKLVLQARNKKLKSELVEAYRNLGKAELKILEDWEPASAELEQDEKWQK